MKLEKLFCRSGLFWWRMWMLECQVETIAFSLLERYNRTFRQGNLHFTYLNFAFCPSILRFLPSVWRNQTYRKLNIVLFLKITHSHLFSVQWQWIQHCQQFLQQINIFCSKSIFCSYNFVIIWKKNTFYNKSGHILLKS